MFSILTFILLAPTSYLLEGKPQPEPQRPRCSDFVDFGYFCVPFFQCDDDSNIITDGETLFDPRLSDLDCNEKPEKSVATTSSCRKLTERCCFHTNYTDTCNTKQGNIKPTSVIKNTNTGRKINRKCGKRNPNGVSVSVTPLQLERDATKFGEWPHVCALLTKTQFEGKELKVFRCGASLIEGGVVLTAAHCLLQPTAIEPAELTVRCGEWNTDAEDQLPFQERDVTTVQIHPCYNNDNLHHDVALLLLRDKFQEEPHISPVCLPEPGTVWLGDCVSNGWGKDKFGANGKYATVLKEVTLPLVDSTECQKLLRKNTRLGPFFELDKSFMCAGGQDSRDTCKGDGGSPLTCELGGSQVQAGIVSWGIGCGEVGVPAVYTDVAAAACWIDGHVRCFYGDENSPSAFGFSSGLCPRRRCEDLDKIQCK